MTASRFSRPALPMGASKDGQSTEETGTGFLGGVAVCGAGGLVRWRDFQPSRVLPPFVNPAVAVHPEHGDETGGGGRRAWSSRFPAGDRVQSAHGSAVGEHLALDTGATSTRDAVPDSE